MAIVLRADKGASLTHAEVDNNFDELNKIPNGKIFPKTEGVGIKLDPADPQFGWEDLTGQLQVYGEVGDAARVIYRGGIKAIQFELSESGYVDFHFPHDYIPGTPIYIHAHWSHASTQVTGGSVTWVFELMYAKGYEQAQFGTPVLVSVVDTVVNTQYTHQIAETLASSNGGSAVALDTNILEVDGIVQCRIYLDSNDLTTGDASTVDPFVHFVDIHYQSSGLSTKGRNFPFYA